MGRKSFNHSRSQARSATCSKVAPGNDARNACGSAATSNSALMRTCGHSGVDPGGGSSTGSSPASSSVIDAAPAASSASSKGAGSAEPIVNVSCRNGIGESDTSDTGDTGDTGKNGLTCVTRVTYVTCVTYLVT